MALQKGEKHRCPDPNCGCEIEVTKGAKLGAGGNVKYPRLKARAYGSTEVA